jgi:hypothetical protein
MRFGRKVKKQATSLEKLRTPSTKSSLKETQRTMRYIAGTMASAVLMAVAAAALSPETVKDGRLQAISSAGIAEAGIE